MATFNPAIPREFIQPSPSDSFIHWLFKGRCISCNTVATEINEIVPRSRSKRAVMMWTNRVTLCQTCHRTYHDGGVTDAKMTEMREKREAFLKRIGREEYIRDQIS